MVADVLAPGDQLLVVVGGGEEAAALVVGEALDHRVGRLAGGVEPAHLERRLVEAQQRLHQVGMILEVGVQPSPRPSFQVRSRRPSESRIDSQMNRAQAEAASR